MAQLFIMSSAAILCNNPLKRKDKVCILIAYFKSTQHKYTLVASANIRTHTQTKTPRQRKQIHQHAKIRLPSQLWVLFPMLFISISPNPCSGACVNAHTCDLTLTLALSPFLFNL